MSTLARVPMPPSKTVSVYGQEMRYFEAGQGPVVVLLHALGWYAEIWGPVMQELAKKHRVLAVDHIGCGGSAKPLLDYRVQTFAEFLEGFLQALKIERAALVGHAFGGWVGTEVAAQFPAMVDRLVLVNASGLTRRYSDRFIDLNPSSFAATQGLLRLVFCNSALATPELAREIFLRRLAFNDGYTVHRALDSIFRYDQFLDPVLENVKAPTLVVWGRYDRITPLPDGNRFARGIANAEMAILDDCGHMPHVEKPDLVSAAIAEFLAR